MEFEPVIGLEVHAQLKTDSKIFCSCSTKFGSEPNSQTCPVCTGMPGVLPVLNTRTVEFAMRMAIATGSKIARKSIFARKNYFYPDLPKAYQISQYEEPLCSGGYIEIQTNGGWKKINLTRIHLEEDAGKLLHPEDKDPHGKSKIDFNRCGVPLLEIVTEPVINSPNEAYLYLMKLKQLLVYLEICDGNMEEGSLRCDANISIMEKGSGKLGVKTEIKNLNSFRGVEKALEYEFERQKRLVQSGEKIVQETLLWDANKNIAVPMRSKEEAHDYRYFPDPDLVPLWVDDKWIDNIKSQIPELPKDKKSRFINQYSLSDYNAEILTTTKELANYFEETAKHCKDFSKASNWIITEVLKILNEKKIEINDFNVAPKNLGTMVKMIEDGTISGKMAKEIFEYMTLTGKSAEEIIKEKGLIQ
ncbi:MAG: Asp-tRNA(Asn)/Glu-tRNA(Gln) amidotransferase subunit GatB, partial [Candidatus Helarchaeota archaeon]|nr:Asp-tRNA(Asn)/Glu-tRNA(Gln) amidotransferase subunit GatB [Candidatus Helarchaeota archaeon]